jgi:aspartate-semialdehyde dehydrogenase
VGEIGVAVVGPSGLVGREILDLLLTRRFPVGRLSLLGSARTAGGTIEHGGTTHRIAPLGPGVFDGLDLVFFAAGPGVAGEHAPHAVRAGAAAIDTSSRYRLDPDVPLVVPEVNAGLLSGRRARGIVACPSAMAVALGVVLAPLAAAAGLRRVVASTYQGAAGAGRHALQRLGQETAALLSGRGSEVRSRGLAFNCVPEIGAVLPGGATAHELQTVEETRRILADPALALSVTAVRVPVFYGHAASLHVETERPLASEDAHEILRRAPGVLLHDATSQGPTSLEAAGTDATHVGRVRRDPAVDHGLALWVALDAVRKGGALNAVEIGEILLRERAASPG